MIQHEKPQVTSKTGRGKKDSRFRQACPAASAQHTGSMKKVFGPAGLLSEGDRLVTWHEDSSNRVIFYNMKFAKLALASNGRLNIWAASLKIPRHF